MRWKLLLLSAGVAMAASIGAAAAAEVIKVTIKGMKFMPAEITAHVGDTIEWTNQDPMAHTATEKNKAWDVSVPAGRVATLLVEKVGAVDYFCRFHPNMKGKIEVVAN